MNIAKSPQKNAFDVRALAQYGLFAAIILLLGLTPIGYITLPIASITTVHIPVIIGGQHFGPKGGILLGFFFGLTSLIRMFITPTAVGAVVLGTATGFGLLNVALIILVTFLPRVLTGLFAALSFKLIARRDKSRVEAFGVAGEGLMAAILGIVSLNGVLEAAAAVVICIAVGKAMDAVARRNKNTNT